MKKALLVANLAGFGSFLLSDMDILRRMGYQVSFAAGAEGHRWEDTRRQLEARQVRFYPVEFDTKSPLALGNAAALRRIGRLLREQRFDLIHCHTPIAGLITRLAALGDRGHPKIVLYTTHGFAFTSCSPRRDWLVYGTMEWAASALCDGIITINREDYENAKKMFCPRVYYIPGVGVPTAEYRDPKLDRAAYRRSIGVEEDQILVLSVGELSRRKNHRIVIEALARLPGRYVYVICGSEVGDGTGGELKALAEARGVQLRLLGFRQDIPQITACSDIGALPSLREGLGLAGVQSLAAGVPVVGSDVQGIRDYVLDGRTGYLCPSGDAAAFARAISRLSDPAVRAGMRACCIRTAERFDLSVSAQRREAIYRELLD